MGNFERIPPESLSDEELLETSIAYPARFVTFYDRHASGLLAFFARRTYDAQVAADLTAETFAQAFAGRSGFRNPGPGTAVAWLYTIGRRQLSRFVRRQYVESRWRERLGIETSPVAADAIERSEELMDLAAVREQVTGAVGALNGDLRQAVTLRVLEGRSYAEAARLAGCTEELLRQRVSRALKRLAKDLDVLGEEDGRRVR